MSAKSNLEIEAKFVVQEPSILFELSAADGLSDQYLLGQPKQGEYLDRYLDSADYSLLRQGYSLRLRSVDDKYLITLKSLKVRDQDQADTRLEIEEAVQANFAPKGIGNLPDAIRAVLRPVVGKSPTWRVTCTIQQTRLKRLILRPAPDLQPIAELSLDQVSIFAGDRAALGPDAEFTPALDQVDELEVELLPGVELAELEPIVLELRHRPGLRVGATSKLEYALAVVSRQNGVAPEGGQGITPEMPVAEACRLIWRTQLTEMLLNEYGVRVSRDIEYVHAMRVAVRRMRTAGRLFGDAFQRPAVRGYLRELRKLTRLLGAVRDLDVLEEHRASFARQRGSFSGGQALAKQWQAARQAHHAELIAWLDGETYSQFVASFADFCQSPSVGLASPSKQTLTYPQPTLVRHVVPGMIMARFERVRAYEVVIEADAPASIEHLHGLRIECKHLRYLLEFARHLLGEDGEQLIRQLKLLQDHLGDLNDAAERQNRLANVNTRLAKAYASEPDTMIDELRATFPEVFGAFVGMENRQLLARTIARL